MTDVPAEEENDAPQFLMCSGCYTPTPVSDAHVIPHWNPTVRRILTTYRCSKCWLPALAETREVVTSGDADVVSSFCDFLANQGFRKDSEAMRAARIEQTRAQLLLILDATEDGRAVFYP